ncbi:MAG: hypothetical protein WAT17_03020 [Candidatus Saccharimonadales bacterium]|jgi:hypothetical protein
MHLSRPAKVITVTAYAVSAAVTTLIFDAIDKGLGGSSDLPSVGSSKRSFFQQAPPWLLGLLFPYTWWIALRPHTRTRGNK